MKRSRSPLFTVLAALGMAAVALTGCGQAVEQAVESAAGVEVDVSDGGMSVTDAEGNVFGGGGTQLPPSFPADLPVPEGARILQFQEQQGAVAVSFSVPSLTEEEFEAYLGTLADAGYPETSRTQMDLGGGYSIEAYLTGSARDAQVSGAAAADGSQATLTIVVSAAK